MSERGEHDASEGTITRDGEYERGMEGAYANLNESLRAYRDVVEADTMEAPRDVYGTKEEVESARETIERSLHYNLEDLTEAQIIEGVERGEVKEADGEYALKKKRELELTKMRQELVNEASRTLDDDERQR